MSCLFCGSIWMHNECWPSVKKFLPVHDYSTNKTFEYLFSFIRPIVDVKLNFYHLKYDEFSMFSLFRLGLQRDDPHQLLSVSWGHGAPTFIGDFTIVRLRNFSPSPQVLLHCVHSFHSETMQSGVSYSGMMLLVNLKVSLLGRRVT